MPLKTSFSLGHLQQRHNAKAKDVLFAKGLQTVNKLLTAPQQNYSVQHLLRDVFSSKPDADLEQVRQVLRPNEAYFFRSQKQLSASGEKLLAWLAAIANPDCVRADGSLDLQLTHDTIRNLVGIDDLPLSGATMRSMRLHEDVSRNVYGENRRASVRLVDGAPALSELQKANRSAVENMDVLRRCETAASVS